MKRCRAFECLGQYISGLPKAERDWRETRGGVVCWWGPSKLIELVKSNASGVVVMEGSPERCSPC